MSSLQGKSLFGGKLLTTRVSWTSETGQGDTTFLMGFDIKQQQKNNNLKSKLIKTYTYTK